MAFNKWGCINPLYFFIGVRIHNPLVRNGALSRLNNKKTTLKIKKQLKFHMELLHCKSYDKQQGHNDVNANFKTNT